MKLKKKHISICCICKGNGYTEQGDKFRWCSACNGHGYILRRDKEEELKAMALSISKETK